MNIFAVDDHLLVAAATLHDLAGTGGEIVLATPPYGPCVRVPRMRLHPLRGLKASIATKLRSLA